jgi:energy-coupling factor transporter ATP-binding protein EcfA2
VKARDNPFRVARVLSAIRYEVAEVTDAAEPPAEKGDADRGAVSLMPRLEALRYRAAIVGPHGSGKTTLLEDLEGALAERGFRIVHVRLDTDDPRLPPEWRSPWRSAWRSRWRSRSPAHRLDAHDIVCLDGAEQLGPIAWRRFRWLVRRAGGLIITTHRSGRLATLIECTTSVGLLHRIIQRLSSDRPAASDTLVGAPSAAELFARHHGNVREALRELYDVHAAASQSRQSHPPRGARSEALV